MERLRIVYYNKDGEASEAIIDAEEGKGHEAAESIEDLGRLCSIMSLGPAEDSPAPLYEDEQPDEEVNEGDAGFVPLSETPEELPYKDGEDS